MLISIVFDTRLPAILFYYAPILEKKKVGTALTADEQTKLDTFMKETKGMGKGMIGWPRGRFGRGE